MLSPTSAHFDKHPPSSHFSPRSQPTLSAHIRKNTTLVYKENACFRRWGKLCWLENSWQSSLDSRLGFIGALADKIKDMNIAKNQPITIISFGCGGLLAEFYLHEYLTGVGFRHLHWRLIDISYHDDASDGLLEEFRRKTGVRDVCAFTSEQAYLNTVSNGQGMANSDRHRGTTVVLSINSPQDSTSRTPVSFSSDCKCFRATGVTDSSSANSLIFMVSPREFMKEADEALVQVFSNNKFMILDNALRYSLNENNELMTDYCDSEFGRYLNYQLKPYKDHLVELTAKLNKTITLANLDKIGNDLAKKLQQEGHMYLVKYYASDYDVSLDNLRRYCAAGSSALFAALDWNKACFA